MDKLKRIRVGYIVFLLLCFGLIAIIIVSRPNNVDVEKPKYEPAPPEAPRLSAMGVIGENVDFEPEVRYYEFAVPEGNPVLPEVWATTSDSKIKLTVDQPHFSVGEKEASAYIYLDDGLFKNSYEIRFVKKLSKGVVLQYDDIFNFVPAYKLNDGESFTFTVTGEGSNITVDSNGAIHAVGVSDEPVTVNAFVGENQVDSIKVIKTIKATLDVFIVAGQGNAAGEGGSADESIRPLPGTAYTVEIDDRLNEFKDLSQGRSGFTPALAAKWYSLTGEKALFVQTAISDVSVTQWALDGEAYKMAADKITTVTDRLKEEKSGYEINKVFCIWLQGEWDIAAGMSSEEYIEHFTEFYHNMKIIANTDMTCIIPVRSSLNLEEDRHLIEPVCSAQYGLSNMYEDVRVVTRISEIASVENGYVSQGNLYYTQLGYNTIGEDVALNLYNQIFASIDKKVQKLEVYANSHDSFVEDGATVEIKPDEQLRTVVAVTPLYADNTIVNVTYNEELVSYYEGGVFGIADTNTDFEASEIVFECGGIIYSFKLAFTKPNDNKAEEKNYSWSFDSLNEAEGKNNLTLSERSTENGYNITPEGVLTSNSRLVDFNMAVPVTLTSESDWEIEWAGIMLDNGILLGGSFNTKGYIYLAPYAQNMGYSVRMVDDSGQTFYLPYGKYAVSNGGLNSWKICYKSEDKTISLYSYDTLVTSLEIEKSFSFTFTNVLGRYGSENVNYCYMGALDRLQITLG